jgi:hypothetical protein
MSEEQEQQEEMEEEQQQQEPEPEQPQPLVFHDIVRRLDGSYVIARNGLPYHVPNEGEYAPLWEQVNEYALAHPEEVTEETPLPPPPAPTLEQAMEAKLREVMAKYNAAFADLEKVYPQHEREGWTLQEEEARAFLADSNAATPVLSALVQLRNRGETVADLVDDIMLRAAQYRGVYAWYTGQQQRMYHEVSALGTVAEILAYPVAYAPLP